MYVIYKYVISQSVCPWQPFKTSLIFVGKAKSLLQVLDSCLTSKHYTRLERLTRGKHSSLSRTSADYGNEKFITLAPDVDNVICIKNKKEFCFSNFHNICIFPLKGSFLLPPRLFPEMTFFQKALALKTYNLKMHMSITCFLTSYELYAD